MKTCCETALDSVWEDFNLEFVSENSVLVVAVGDTSCDTSLMGDGVCDVANNHMGCNFDDGDCCEATSSGTFDDGQQVSTPDTLHQF